jgi:hypothetical protein
VLFIILCLLGRINVLFCKKGRRTWVMLFIIRLKRELKRVYINGCRYNERLNTETEGSKTPFKKPKYLSVCDREERGRGEGQIH